MEIKEERERRKNSKETRAHLESMVLRTKPEANKWLHLTPRNKYIKTERYDLSWAAQEGQLLNPAPKLDLISGMRSPGTSMDIFVRGVGVGLTHTEKLLIKKSRIARETSDLDAEKGKDPKKPDIGRVVESYLNLPNE